MRRARTSGDSSAGHVERMVPAASRLPCGPDRVRGRSPLVLDGRASWRRAGRWRTRSRAATRWPPRSSARDRTVSRRCKTPQPRLPNIGEEPSGTSEQVSWCAIRATQNRARNHVTAPGLVLPSKCGLILPSAAGLFANLVTWGVKQHAGIVAKRLSCGDLVPTRATWRDSIRPIGISL